MKNIEKALGTFKGESEGWEDVFNRVNSLNGIDHRTMVRLLLAIINVLDNFDKEDASTKDDMVFIKEDITNIRKDLQEIKGDILLLEKRTKPVKKPKTRTKKSK